MIRVQIFQMKNIDIGKHNILKNFIISKLHKLHKECHNRSKKRNLDEIGQHMFQKILTPHMRLLHHLNR